MLRPQQPQFKISVPYSGKSRVSVAALKNVGVTSSKGTTSSLDIESCVAYPVIYKEQADLISTLNFTVNKHADLLLYYFHIGQAVKLYGGYYADNESGMRLVFSGTVTRIVTHFADNGVVSFSVECMNYGFTRFGKDYKNFTYPDSRSSRKFARAETMSLGDIIRGIAEENHFEIGEINLSTAARKVNFDKINIRYQKNCSDWKFLTNLAQDFGCNVWIETENDVDKLYFVSHEKAFKRQASGISFLYPIYGVTNKELHWDGTIRNSEIQKFSDSAYNRPRIIRDVSVVEDIASAYSVTRSAVYFDKETGEYKDSVAVIGTDKDGNPINTLTFYELDEAKVEWVNQNLPEVAKYIRTHSPTSMAWGDPKDPYSASYYYKVHRIYDAQTAVFDKAFFGITVTAKCNQDLNIHSQRTYKIRGILSYRSKDLSTSFFLRGLSHVWDSDGNWTELDFIR